MNGLGMLALWSGAAAVIALIVGWTPASAWLNTNASLAGWVQAIGSIAAILATAWAVDRAHRLQKKEADRKEFLDYTRMLEAVFQLVGGTHRIASKIADYIAPLPDGLASAQNLRKMRAEVMAIRDALDRVDVTRLDRFHFVQAVLVSNAVLPDFLHEIDVALDGVNIEGECDAGDVAAKALEVASVVQPFGKLLLTAINQRGGAARSDTFPP
ncbi:hypothetical protein [Variovorax atrisoli]|uniref:hypothetical protein n=1 Tax=Variovorax atrisoli TaxID=3394203 RepID=UPI00403FD190